VVGEEYIAAGKHLPPTTKAGYGRTRTGSVASGREWSASDASRPVKYLPPTTQGGDAWRRVASGRRAMLRGR
jgi:hypothetical protein